MKKFIKLGQNFISFNTDYPIGIYGYSYSKTEFKIDEYNNRYVEAYQYGIRFKNLLIPSKNRLPSPIISYKNFTEMGHSGSPVILFTIHIDILIAIHLGKSSGEFINEGLLITDNIYNNLIEWQELCKGDPF